MEDIIYMQKDNVVRKTNSAEKADRLKAQGFVRVNAESAGNVEPKIAGKLTATVELTPELEAAMDEKVAAAKALASQAAADKDAAAADLAKAEKLAAQASADKEAAEKLLAQVSNTESAKKGKDKPAEKTGLAAAT